MCPPHPSIKPFPHSNRHVLDYVTPRSHCQHHVARLASNKHGAQFLLQSEFNDFKSQFISEMRSELRSDFYDFFQEFRELLFGRKYRAPMKASQFLRIITFLSTQLPGPNYHCREGSKLARLPRPDNVLEVLLINFPRGVIYGCGDLIFSSHMIFSLVFVLTYQKYGSQRCIKQLAWLMAVIQSLLIIASRKHYTVDVVVAWYTVNLVVYFVNKKLPELPDRTTGAAPPLLPLSTKDKDGKSKEELHKLLNGNSGDIVDWRQRLQFNGMLVEDGNAVLADASTNGS